MRGRVVGVNTGLSESVVFVSDVIGKMIFGQTLEIVMTVLREIPATCKKIG